MKKVNVFVDMDGVLAVYHKDTVKYMYDKNFFLNRPPMENMVKTIKQLVNNNEHDVYILSSVIDSPHCIPEKDEWLNKHLPEIKKEKRIFVPYGVVKSDYAKSKVDVDGKINVLIDDYTNNLVKWNLPNALPIKALNGINNKKGTWYSLKGETIETSSSQNLTNITKLINNKKEKISENSKSSQKDCKGFKQTKANSQSWHISKDGKVRPCKATKKPCPLGGTNTHFRTKEAAEKYVSEQLEGKHGLLPKVSEKRK